MTAAEEIVELLKNWAQSRCNAWMDNECEDLEQGYKWVMVESKQIYEMVKSILEKHNEAA